MIQRLIRQYINNYKYFGNTKYLKNTNDNQTDHILLEKINEASGLSPSYRIIERFGLKGVWVERGLKDPPPIPTSPGTPTLKPGAQSPIQPGHLLTFSQNRKGVEQDAQ